MAESSEAAAWIAADWGTSALRIWAMDDADRVIGTARSDRGMGGLDRDGFETAFLEIAGPFLAIGAVTDVIVCGMAGAREGWAEAGYAKVPCAPAGDAAVTVQTVDPRLNVRILPGLSQASPADVMRGEETQIAGFLRLAPDFDGVICLPGTHTKWAHVSAGEVVSFRTFMTGELFALLSKNSVLRHVVAGDGWDAGAFTSGLSDAMSRPESVAAKLFGLRASALLDAVPPATARAQLSGLLIGMELAASRPYWLGQRVALIGADALVALYETALAGQGVPTEKPADDVTLSGLVAARHKLKGTKP